MLDDRLVLRERIFAAATFAGIAFATVIALDFMVTGGFDFGARRSTSTYADPFGVAADAAAAQSPDPLSVTALALIDPLMMEAAPPEDLADTSAVSEQDEDVAAPSEDELYREIAKLYEDHGAAARANDPHAGASIEEPAHEDAPATEDEDVPVPFDDRDLRPDPGAPDTE